MEEERFGIEETITLRPMFMEVRYVQTILWKEPLIEFVQVVLVLNYMKMANLHLTVRYIQILAYMLTLQRAWHL